MLKYYLNNFEQYDQEIVDSVLTSVNFVPEFLGVINEYKEGLYGTLQSKRALYGVFDAPYTHPGDAPRTSGWRASKARKRLKRSAPSPVEYSTVDKETAERNIAQMNDTVMFLLNKKKDNKKLRISL